MHVRSVQVQEPRHGSASALQRLPSGHPSATKMTRVQPSSVLEPWQIIELQDRHTQGVAVDALALRYGVGRRTVYRYLASRVERIYVDGWTAFFALGHDKRAPQRLTKWERA